MLSPWTYHPRVRPHLPDVLSAQRDRVPHTHLLLTTYYTDILSLPRFNVNLSFTILRNVLPVGSQAALFRYTHSRLRLLGNVTAFTPNVVHFQGISESHYC